MKPLRLSQRTQLEKQLERAIVGATPSLHVSVLLQGERTWQAKLGEAATYFDLASLTKVIFTTSRLMQAVEKSQLDIEQSVSSYLPWFTHRNVRVHDLLTHSAGFRWWSPFYKDLDASLSFRERWMQLQMMLRDEEPIEGLRKAEYSDVDYFFLGLVLEAIEKRPLIDIWNAFHKENFSEQRLHFCENNKPPYPRKLYAPTEKCLLRSQIVQGEVHDENAWTLGGVAPHAGLFGRLEDVERWALSLRSSYRGEGGFVSAPVAQTFLSRQIPNAMGDFALGFMMPTAGGSSAGSLISPSAVGHTGFTGTSFWWDIEKDVIVILLANRVHPTRENKLFVQLRPQIHNWIMEQLQAA